MLRLSRRAFAASALGSIFTYPYIKSLSKAKPNEGTAKSGMSTMVSRAQLEQYWQDALVYQSSLPNQVYPVSDVKDYPTESAMTFVSAFLYTKHDDRKQLYKDAAKRQLDFARAFEDSNHVTLRCDDNAYRDSHARHIYNLWIAGYVMGEPKYQRGSYECARAMFEQFKRIDYFDRRNQQFRIYSPIYYPNGHRGYDPLKVGGKEYFRGIVDPNQNAAIGLAFTLMYHDPNSPYYRNNLPAPPFNRDNGNSIRVAQEEFGAVFSLQVYAESQDSANRGRLPMNDADDRLDNFDTLYAPKTFHYASLAFKYWKDSADSRQLNTQLNTLLAHGSDWLTEARFWDDPKPGVRYTATTPHRPYPVFPTAEECWDRLALYWRQNARPTGRHIWKERALNQVINDRAGTAPGKRTPAWQTPFCYFHLVDMPENEFLPES